MERENEKQVISLKDIFFGILYRWKGIVAVMLIGAALLGGMQLCKTPGDPQDTLAKVQNLEQQLAVKNNAIENQEDYLQNSYLMCIDPYNLYEVNISFYIYADYQILPQLEFQNPDNTPALLNAYQVLLGDRALIQRISDTVGIDRKYISELLITNATTTGYPGVLTVTVIHQNAEDATAIADLIQEYLKSHTDSLQQQLGKHTLSAISTISGPKTNQDVVNHQKKATEYLVTLRTEHENLQKQHADLESSILDASPVLMAIIGAVIGAILAVIAAFLIFMGSGKVYSAQVLFNRTGIKILGCVPGTRKRDIIIRGLRKAEGRSTNREDIQIPATLISNHCTGMQQILIAGKCDETTMDTLRNILTGNGLQVCCFDSLLGNAEALSTLPKSDAVVLVETCAVSTYANVEHAMACIEDHNKQLIGCILIDG